MAKRFNAQHIGSLLRPRYLLDARHRGAPPDELRQVEDRAIGEVLKYQEDLGLPLVSDGEYRRALWMKVVASLYEGLDPEGFERVHHDEEGHEEHFGVPSPVARLSRRSTWVDFELAYAKQHTSQPIKVAMPSPSLMMGYFKPGVSDKVYADREAYMDDLVCLMNEDAKMLAAAGCAYIQIDAPQYTYVTDPKVRPDVTDPQATLSKMIQYDNRVFEGVTGAITGLHLCRGNYKSMFTGTKPYDDYAETVFTQATCDQLLLEYDDYRSGDFTPLRFVPAGAEVVLGLLTTKTSDMETEDNLKRRIDDAAKYVPLERLALSPQCGFATHDEGNRITRDAEKAKLELVVKTAQDVWGQA